MMYHTKYQGCRPCIFRQEDFKKLFPILTILYNINLLAYQQNTMPLAIYNTKQYDIHQVSPLYKTQARSVAETSITTPSVTNRYTHVLTHVYV